MSIEERVINIINKILGVEASIDDTFEYLYIDDIDLADIIDECEQEFCYPISDDKVQSLNTIQDLVNLITDLNTKNVYTYSK